MKDQDSIEEFAKKEEVLFKERVQSDIVDSLKHFLATG